MTAATPRALSAWPDVVAEATAVLAAAAVERPRWAAEQITASVVGGDPAAWVMEPLTVEASAHQEILRRAARRSAGVPLQYVTGIAGFFGRDCSVAPGVLIPRPETECLVEVALEELARLRLPRPVVWDVGTGSGAIALNLTLEAPASILVGFDTSPRALAVARENARRLGVVSRVQWVCADLLAACGEWCADLIVANLPYISTGELSTLPREVQQEPREALDGGPQGLTLIRRLLAQAATRLRTGGTIILEVGDGQARRVQAEWVSRWADVAIRPDAAGRERIIICRRAVGIRGKTGH